MTEEEIMAVLRGITARLCLMEDIMEDLEENSDKIYVRAEIEGSWKNIALSELPGDIAIKKAMNFIRSLRPPVFDDESNEKKNQNAGYFDVIRGKK